MGFPMIAVGIAQVLPTIVNSLAALNHDLHLFKDDEVNKIAGIAGAALQGIPEAIASFVKLQEAIGGRAPNSDELRALSAEIRTQSGEIEELRQQSHEGSKDLP